MAATSDTRLSPPTSPSVRLTRGRDPYHQAAAVILLGQALLWLFLLFRWATFSVINWQPIGVELALAEWTPFLAYVLFGGLLALNLAAGLALWRDARQARPLAVAAALAALLVGAAAYALIRDFYGAVLLMGCGGLLLLLLGRHTAWALAFPSAYWLLIFFLIPLAMAMGIGLVFSNTRAVLEALFGIQSSFVRTPKYKVENSKDNWLQVAAKYKRKKGFLPYIELAFALYFVLAVAYAIRSNIYATIPFLLIFLLGYGYMAMMSLFQGRVRKWMNLFRRG